MRRGLVAIALVLLPVLAARAQDPASAGGDGAGGEAAGDTLPAAHRPRVKVAVTPDHGLVTGDAVTLTITAVAKPGDDVAVPKQSFDPFVVRKKNARVENVKGGGKRFVFELELLAFEPGEHTVGPVELRIVTTDGTIGAVRTDPVTLRVRSLIANEPNAKPKPPTKPVSVVEKDYTLLWIAGGLAAAMLLVLATLLAARWWQRRKRAAAPPAPPRPPHEVALEKLHALRRDRPRAEAEGRLGEWVDGVSDALRQYLGGRYGFDGLESTTDELLAHLRKAALSQTLHTEVALLLGECDLIKFARASPEPDRCTELLRIAYEIVHRTRPVAAPSPPSPSQEAAA